MQQSAQQNQVDSQFAELPENCSNARYLDIRAEKLMGSGSFGKFNPFFDFLCLTALFCLSQDMSSKQSILTRANQWLLSAQASLESMFQGSLRCLTD